MRTLAFGLATVLAFLVLATVLRTTDVLVGSPDAERTGAATVVSCTAHGPVGRWGFGTAHECTADVRWTGDGAERVVFPPGQLEPGDRDVAVVDSGREPGRAGSARWYLAGSLATVALGLLTVCLAAATVLSLFSRRLGKRFGRRRDRDERWPVTEADLAATPVTRRLRRVRLVAWLGLGVVAAEALASMPYFDAPRRVGGFVSPWPQLESAWLVDPPSGLLAGCGALVALLAVTVADLLHRDAARIVRYGQTFVDTRPARTLAGGRSWVPTMMIAALFVWAMVSVARALPGSAPFPVWLAGSRDAVILLTLLVIMLATRQPVKGMIDQLLRKSEEPQPRA